MQRIKQILIIEDNPSDLLLLKEYIAMVPVEEPEVLSIERLSELSILPADYSPDLVFLDLLLPDSHGLDTLIAVSEKLPAAAIIVLSGLEDTDLALQAIQAGAQDYLLKGEIDEKTLLRTVRHSIERKRIQHKLKESEERYRILVDSAPEALVVFDINEGKFTDVSDTAVELFKLSREELLKIGPINVSPEFQPDGIRSEISAREKLQQAIEGKRPAFEWTHCDSEGNSIPCEVRLVRLPAEDKILIRGSITDISERKQADEALRLAEETRRLIMHSALDAIICMDLEGHIIVWTPQAEKIFGWKENEVLGKSVAEAIIPPALREQHWQGMKRYLATGEARVLNKLIEITAIDRNEKEFPVELTIAMIQQGSSRFFCAFLRDITERVKSREALKESEERYRSVIEQASDAIMITDQKGNFLDVNTGFCRLLGYTRDEMTGMNISMVIDPEQLQNDPVRMDVYREGKHVFRERRMVHKDGHIIEVEANIKMLPDQRVLAIARDITERKKAEAAILKVNDRLKHIAQATNDAIWDHDVRTGEIWWNDKLYEIYGIDPKEKPGGFQEWKDRIHPDDRDRVLSKLKKTQDAKKSYWQDEYRFQLPDGSYANMYDRNYYLYEGGELIRKSGSNLDISALKKAEETLINSELRYRTLTSNAPVGIFQTDKDGKTIYVNETWMEYTGLSYEESMGFGWVKALHPDERETLLKSWEQQSGTETNASSDFRFIDKGGNTRWVSGNAIPLYNKNGEFIGHIGTLTDISQRKKSETELLKMNERLQLVSQAAHDALWDHDLQTGVIWWNEKQFEFFGSDPKDGPQDHLAWVQRIHPDDRERVVRGFEEKQKKGEPFWSDEYRFRLPNGEYVYLYDRSMFIYEKGKLIRIAGSTVDITALKKVEAALTESEEKYRMLVKQAGDAIFIFEENGQFIDVNDVSCELLGYTKDELKSMTLYDINFSEDLINNPVRIDLLQEGESVIRRRRFRRKDNSSVEVEVNSKKLPDGRFLGMVRDLTERIKAQQLIEKEKKLADNIIASLPGLFYLFDHTGKYIRWNKFKETLTEYSAEEISKMAPLDFFEGKEKDRVREHIMIGFTTGETNVEAQITTKTGKKLDFYFTGINVDYEGKSCLLGTGIDISDRKKAEDLLKQSSEQLRQLSAHLQHIREEERITIAREIHDELGQQLTVMKMDISWLKKRIGKPDVKTETKLNDLLGMIDHTVRTVRKISSDLRPSMLDDLGLVAALEWHSGEFEKRSGVKTDFVSELPEIKLPSDTVTGMYRIFQESLTNVARHAKATKVHAELKMEDGKLALRIQDNGKGFSVSSIGQKKTLGILGMRERVFIMNGKYSIESVPGEGTMVEITIPLETSTNS